MLVLGVLPGSALAADDTVTINVYNWGQYISDGSDDCLDIIAAFEEAYPNIKVNYTTFDSNETLYSKLKTGGVSYDVIIPSDYMIARLIDEGYLMELDYSNIPNFTDYVDDTFKNPNYDPENKYSVPYTWGTVGIIYNTKYVDASDVTGWEVLWNEKYKGKILMFDNPRDAFALAELELGYSLNTEDSAELQASGDLLVQQKPLVQSYVMDQIYDKMINEEAWVAPYYAGDFVQMSGDNEDLAFYLPVDDGFNFFVDALCIPTCAEHKAEAETFINFLTSPEISAANMEWVGYGSPTSAAREYLDPEIADSEVVYPSADALSHGEMFLYLTPEATQKMDELWLNVKTSSSNTTIYIVIGAAAVVIIVLAIVLMNQKKKKKKARRGSSAKK